MHLAPWHRRQELAGNRSCNMCERLADSGTCAGPPASQSGEPLQAGAPFSTPSQPQVPRTSPELPLQQMSGQYGENSAAEEPVLGSVALLRALFEAQEVRGATYQRLHASFRRFITARDEAAYKCAPIPTLAMDLQFALEVVELSICILSSKLSTIVVTTMTEGGSTYRNIACNISL